MTNRLYLACVLSVGVGLVGCTKSNPVSCADGYCQDPALPFCDVDGALAGEPLTCIAVSCTPGDFAGCRDDQALICNTGGDNYDLSHCAFGCDAASGCKVAGCVPSTVKCGDRVVERCDAEGVLTTKACDLACVEAPEPHCAHISPKYLPDICDSPATEPMRVVSVSESFTTSIDSLCNGGIVPQQGGPDICVVRYGTFSIESTGAWGVSGSRALAIVTDGPLRIAGSLGLSAFGSMNGPGGGRAPSGGRPFSGTGGGGAGFATPGAAGGSTTSAGGAANGGAQADPLASPVLQGGYSGNGAVGGPPVAGGGGGGTLISCGASVTVEGTIAANGGGGRGGALDNMIANRLYGGGGGGSGGYIVLQGLNVLVAGRVFANGGGGGCGKPSSATSGMPGHDGGLGIAASQPCAPTVDEGSGGSGGAQGIAPQVGGASTAGTPGGGGGSVGYFQSYTPAGVIPTLTPSAQSPGFQPNLSVSTR
jgi:hypothetical protein